MNDTCDTLKRGDKYAHHFLYFALILCFYHVTGGTDSDKETAAV
jgi:hypothetical protein